MSGFLTPDPPQNGSRRHTASHFEQYVPGTGMVHYVRCSVCGWNTVRDSEPDARAAAMWHNANPAEPDYDAFGPVAIRPERQAAVDLEGAEGERELAAKLSAIRAFGGGSLARGADRAHAHIRLDAALGNPERQRSLDAIIDAKIGGK